jgi:hypothetical protein
MMRKYLIWFIAGPIIVALGFWGWHYMRNRSLEESAKLASQNQAQPYLPPDESPKPDQDTLNRQNLEQGIKNFRAAKSFRASISQPTAQGVITGEIEYVKPLRLHAVLTEADQQVSELIIIGGTVYVRKSKNTWEMSNNAFAKGFGQTFFSSMLVSDDTLASFGIEDNESITVKDDNSKHCKNYSTMYKQEEKKFNIQFCLNDQNQIVNMVTENEDGSMTASYKDFNALFLIERPMMPLLEPRKPGEMATSTQ